MEQAREKVKQLLKIFYNIDTQYSRAVRRTGYKPNLLMLFYSLDNNKPMSQKQICEDWCIPKTTVNTLIKECEQQGYITFEAVKGQRREKVVILTESGKKYAHQLLSTMYQAEEEAVDNMENVEEFIPLADKFLENLKTAFEKRIK